MNSYEFQVHQYEVYKKIKTLNNQIVNCMLINVCSKPTHKT